MNAELLEGLSWLLFWTVVWGGIGGTLGQRLKNRAVAGCVWGILLGPLGLLVVVAMGGNNRKCWACKSLVPRDASRCRYCGEQLKPQTIRPQVAVRLEAQQQRIESQQIAQTMQWLSESNGVDDHLQPLKGSRELSDDEVQQWLKSLKR